MHHEHSGAGAGKDEDKLSMLLSVSQVAVRSILTWNDETLEIFLESLCSVAASVSFDLIQCVHTEDHAACVLTLSSH